jgi:hypothetical protein
MSSLAQRLQRAPPPVVDAGLALATAWAAGHRLWSLLVAGFFVLAGIGVGYQALVPNQPAVQVLGDVMRDTVLFAAVLLLGEAVRTRRALQREQERSERLLLNVLPRSIAARLKQHEGVIADGFPEVTVLRNSSSRSGTTTMAVAATRGRCGAHGGPTIRAPPTVPRPPAAPATRRPPRRAPAPGRPAGRRTGPATPPRLRLGSSWAR